VWTRWQRSDRAGPCRGIDDVQLAPYTCHWPLGTGPTQLENQIPVSDQAIRTYQAFFETISAPTVENIRNLATADFRYRDPLMDSRGINVVIASMHKWFADLDGIKFAMTDHAVSDRIVFQHWIMTFRIRKLPKRLWELEGVSRITFNEDDLIVDQIDYWDTAPMLQSVPVLGRVVTVVSGLFAHK